VVVVVVVVCVEKLHNLLEMQHSTKSRPQRVALPSGNGSNGVRRKVECSPPPRQFFRTKPIAQYIYRLLRHISLKLCPFLCCYRFSVNKSLYVFYTVNVSFFYFKMHQNTPWAIKKCHFILDHNSQVSWWIFTLFCTDGNRNEYSADELQNLQLYPNCVSTLPDKTKTT